MWEGCFITRVEKILIGDNITFIDPCLEIINMPLTTKNRMNASVLAAFSYMITLSFIFILYIAFNPINESISKTLIFILYMYSLHDPSNIIQNHNCSYDICDD